jgi:hypothetical protein
MVSFTPRPLYPGERDCGTHRIGGWVNLRIVRKTLRREKSRPYRDSNSEPSTIKMLLIKLQLKIRILGKILQRHGKRNDISKANFGSKEKI